MKLFSLFGAVRTLRAGVCALLYTACLLLPYTVHAATWQWNTVAGRERLTIQLDGTEGEHSFARTGTHAITLGLSAPPAQFSLSGAAPGVTSLVSDAQVRGNEIELALRTPAFGYMVTRPSAHQIVVDIFPDPLGARWTASGRLGPASATSAIAPAAPARQAMQAVPPAPFPVSPSVAPAVHNVQRPPDSTAIAPAVTVPAAPLAVQKASKPENPKGLALMPPESPALSAPMVEAGPSHDVFSDDNTLPEMSASGALRENPLPPATAGGLSQAPPVTPAELGESAGKFLTDMVKGVMSLNAHAANDTTNTEQAYEGRARILTPQSIRASVNSDGPEAWSSEDSLSTRLPVAAGVAVPTSMPVTAPPVTEGAQAGSSATPPPTSPARATGEIRQSITPPGSTPAQSASTSSQAPAHSALPAAPTAQSPRANGTVEQSKGLAPAVSTVALPAPVPATSASPAAEGTKAAGTTPPASASANAVPPDTAPDSAPQLMNETRQTATQPKHANATAVQGNATRPVVYVNEKGETVPKPPEPDKMLAEAEALMDKSQYSEALPILQELKVLPLGAVQHEKILYHIADATASLYAGKPLEGFDPITATTSEAMNANLRSSRVPDALFRLGMTHLDVGNLSEAEGYFKALKRRHPYDMNVPVAFKNLGIAQLQAGKSAQAAQTLQTVVQEYPETVVLREASVGLARALYAENDLDKMAVITDFIDKRWPRYYVQDQAYLLMLADSQSRMNRLENALQHYWLYYNLVPANKENDMVLANIGDLYLRTGRLSAAKELFDEIRTRYPGSDGAAIALLRLAEQGIHDTPITIDEMFRVFVLAGDPKPPVAYKELQRDYSKDPRAVVAGLKLAMWQLWTKEYTDAMGAAADFIDAYPEHRDVEQARQVIMRAFGQELKNALAEENFGRILILWNGFPLVRERYGKMDANMRHALARGYIERGDDEKALELLSEFLKSPKDAVYSDYAFTLFFNKYLQAANWNALLDLGELVKDWPMKAEMRSQLDYALALSSENLGLADKALPLWQQLAVRTDIPLYEQAYATYFLAKDAERRRDIKAAYRYNVDTLALFQKLEKERSDRADPDRIKEAMGSLMDITEVGNHIPEALEWLERYTQFVPEDSPEYPGLRFRESRLYRKLGDNAKAKSLLEQLLKKAPDSAFGQAAAIELRTFEVSRDLQNFIKDK